jgi:hypothetical protein
VLRLNAQPAFASLTLTRDARHFLHRLLQGAVSFLICGAEWPLSNTNGQCRRSAVHRGRASLLKAGITGMACGARQLPRKAMTSSGCGVVTVLC